MHGVYVKNACGKELAGNWAGHDQKNPPAIGDRVKVNMNSMGEGKVIDYFAEKGGDNIYVGVVVWLDNPPAWFLRQAAEDPEIKGAMVFGPEILY